MFSPAVVESGPAGRTRSRRRQRPKSNENLVQPPKSKRQRPLITQTTFVSPEAVPETQQAPILDAPPPKFEIKRDAAETLFVPKQSQTLRTKKPKAGERASKGDGSVVLATTNAYTVSRLPALPDRMRADTAASQYGEVYSNGYALNLTHTHAIVWPYASATPSPETFIFTLPYPSKNPSDPVPIGSLVSPSAASAEPGLVVVMPASGKVTYWESISSAATIDLMRQQRHGVEAAIYGMFSGERVIQITNAETAGFLLAFSSGRFAHLNVRDSHGRPSVTVQFLNTSLGSVHTGILGSIRHALSHSTSRGDVAAIHAERASSRVGERNVVAATRKGRLHAWQVHRGGHCESLADADIRDMIISSIREVDRSATDFPLDSFELLDFTHVPRGLEPRYLEMSRLSDAMASEDSSIQHLLILVSVSKRHRSIYSLVEVILSPSFCRVGMVRPITSFNTPIDVASPSTSLTRPRLYLPRPALVAFVVFDSAVVVASIANSPESPESQLQGDSHIAPEMYEDVIDLREDRTLRVAGSGLEEPSGPAGSDDARGFRNKPKSPAVILMVRGAGLLRVATTDVDKFASEQPPQVTAKGRLEQAVFFGAKTDNPLRFSGERDVQFTDEEISDAALELSHEILSSTTPHIATLPVSMEDNLVSRSLALERLMRYVKRTGAILDRKSRWTLLWNAEKMLVASHLWKEHEGFVSLRRADDKKTLMAEIVEYIHEDQKKDLDVSAGEVDRVRHWFINDVFRLELFVAWAYEVIKYTYKDQSSDDSHIASLIYEAVVVNVTALSAAYRFRAENLALYGLDQEDIKDGLLANYSGLAEPWTGSYFVANDIKRLLELCHQWLSQCYPPPDGVPTTGHAATVAKKIVRYIPDITELQLRSLLEQSRWALSSSDPKKVIWGRKCAESYNEERYTKVLALGPLDLWDDAERIAENHESWLGLADILIVHVQALRKKAALSHLSPSETQTLEEEADRKEAKIRYYAEKHGEKFAFAAYDVLGDKQGVDGVLNFANDTRGFKTRYLRSKPQLAPISWMNDVLVESDIGHAAETLIDLSLNKEQHVWNKKIELSIAKLALLAEAEGDAPSAERQEDQEKKVSSIEQALDVVRIQNQLFQRVYPTIYTAVDEAAEVELAITAHGSGIAKTDKVLLQIFESGIKNLVRHDALEPLTLVDLLTLGQYSDGVDSEPFPRFFFALEVAGLCLTGEEQRLTRRLIWRRCYLSDGWDEMNDTQLKADTEVRRAVSATNLFETLVAIYTEYGPEISEAYRPLKPSEVLGVYEDSVDRRFEAMEKTFKDRLSDAMKREDTRLRKSIRKNRLEEWARSVVEAAQAETLPEGIIEYDVGDGEAVPNDVEAEMTEAPIVIDDKTA